MAPSVRNMETTLAALSTSSMQPPKSLQNKHRHGKAAVRNSRSLAAKPASKNQVTNSAGVGVVYGSVMVLF